MAAPEIHPTAIVAAGADLGEGVVIGPYCVVEGRTRLGDGCRLLSHVHVGPRTSAGPENVFYPFASVGLQSQDLKYEGEPTHLEIGSGNTFREHVTVHRATGRGERTVVGNHCHFLAYAHVAHDCRVGDHVIFSNNGTVAGHVVVEDHAVIGGLTAVHQFCRIGRHAMTGGCSKIVQDVPPFCLADGNPARLRGINQVGLERRGFAEESIRNLRSAYRLLCRSGLNLQQAVERIREECGGDEQVACLLDFIAASQRGIIR